MTESRITDSKNSNLFDAGPDELLDPTWRPQDEGSAFHHVDGDGGIGEEDLLELRPLSSRLRCPLSWLCSR